MLTDFFRIHIRNIILGFIITISFIIAVSLIFENNIFSVFKILISYILVFILFKIISKYIFDKKISIFFISLVITSLLYLIINRNPFLIITIYLLYFIPLIFQYLFIRFDFKLSTQFFIHSIYFVVAYISILYLFSFFEDIYISDAIISYIVFVFKNEHMHVVSFFILKYILITVLIPIKLIEFPLLFNLNKSINGSKILKTKIDFKKIILYKPSLVFIYSSIFLFAFLLINLVIINSILLKYLLSNLCFLFCMVYFINGILIIIYYMIENEIVF